MATPEEIDDELYKDIKRGDWVLYWDEDVSSVIPIHSVTPMLVASVDDTRILTLVFAPGLAHTATAAEREHAIIHASETLIKEHVPRFNRSTGKRHHTWCGIH